MNEIYKEAEDYILLLQEVPTEALLPSNLRFLIACSDRLRNGTITATDLTKLKSLAKTCDVSK